MDDQGQLPETRISSDLSELFTEIVSFTNRIKDTVASPEVQRMFEAASYAASQINEFNKNLRTAVGPLVTFIGELAAKEQIIARISNAGWLAHQTTPIHELHSGMTTDEIDQTLIEFYASEIDHVEQIFIESVERYGLDEQVRLTFFEALKCHRMGCYRATVRLLFPEIERVACVQFYDGNRKKIAGLPGFAEAVGMLPLGDFPDVEAPVQLFSKLENHMYMNVWDDSTLQRVSNDPVPNRHAAIHGWVDYNSLQNSVNALILADFVFQLFGCLKALHNRSEIAAMSGRNGTNGRTRIPNSL